MKGTNRWMKTVALGLALAAMAGTAPAQDTRWDREHDAGWKAFQEGRLDEAETWLRSARTVARTLGADDPRLATTLDHLAWVLCAEGKFDQAEPLAKQALAIREKALGPQHEDTARSLNTLACLYDADGRLDEARARYEQALSILAKRGEGQGPGATSIRDNLATIAHAQSRHDEAEALYKQSLTAREKAPDSKPIDLTPTLQNLATLYLDQGKYDQAEPLYKRVLAIREKSLPPDHPEIATSLEALAWLYEKQGKPAEAAPLLERALTIYEKALGPAHPHVARCCTKMTDVYGDLKRYDRAEACCKQALGIYERAPEVHSSALAEALEDYARVLRANGPGRRGGQGRGQSPGDPTAGERARPEVILCPPRAAGDEPSPRPPGARRGDSINGRNPGTGSADPRTTGRRRAAPESAPGPPAPADGGDQGALSGVPHRRRSNRSDDHPAADGAARRALRQRDAGGTSAQ